MRDYGSGFIRNEITSNPFISGALFLRVGLFLLAVYVTVLTVVLKLANPGAGGSVLAIGL